MNKSIQIYLLTSTIVFLTGAIMAWIYHVMSRPSVNVTKVVSHPKVDDLPPQQYLNHKTKCFQCEKQLLQDVGDDGVWFAQPSKLYDAEQDGIAQTRDLSGGYMGKTVMFY